MNSSAGYSVLVRMLVNSIVYIASGTIEICHHVILYGRCLTPEFIVSEVLLAKLENTLTAQDGRINTMMMSPENILQNHVTHITFLTASLDNRCVWGFWWSRYTRIHK